MKKVIIRLEKEADAPFVLCEIGKKIAAGYISGEEHGAKWWMEID